MEGATVIDYSSFSSIIETITSQISWANVVGILGSIVLVCAGFAFGWWGVRKVVRMLMSAFKKGKVSV